MNPRLHLRAADEKTEILLTDYLDGRLPPDRRAELDAYLAANPAQQQALTEIIHHRDHLRALPPEPAPPEIYHAVAAQLERLALVHDADPLPLRPRRRALPHLAAIAATILLAAGLATALYFVLAPNKSPFTLATSASPPTPETAKPPPPVTTHTLRSEPLSDTSPGRTPLTGRPLPVPPSPSAARGPTASAGQPGSPRLAAPSPVADGAPRSPAGPFAAIAANLSDEHRLRPADLADVVPLPSSNPSAARTRAESLLRDGGWAFSEAPADVWPLTLPCPLPLPGHQTAWLAIGFPASEVPPVVVRVEPDQIAALRAALTAAPDTATSAARERSAITPPPPLAQGSTTRTVRILLYFPARP